MSFAGGRSPFRPLQQAKHPDTVKMQHSSRLHDSPMDFDYDAPSRQRPTASSTWLNAPEQDGVQGGAKRSMDDIRSAEDDAFVFGVAEEATGSGASRRSGGAFLFHQPLSPTIAGPDVEMAGETPPSTKRAEAGAHVLDEDEEEKGRRQSSSGRRLASQGALLRVNRQREKSSGGTAKKAAQSHRRKPSLTLSARDDEDEHGDEDASGEWEDLQAGATDGKRRSLRKRVGDTLNIQYYFNHAVDRDVAQQQQQHGRDQGRTAREWLDPEWCLGMVQFGFNSTLLLGIVWVLFNVVRTLQRDVSSKVRAYELEYLAEIEACSQSYHLNRCGTAGAVPALASACASWQRCSARDPGSVGRARVAAETVAEIVNGFVDVVSWKSMLFTLLALIIVVGATNSFLSFFRIRSRQQHVHPANVTPYAAALPPHDGYNLRSAHDRQHLYNAGGGSAEERRIHDAYMRSSGWQPSAPATPSSKRMCR